MLASAVVAGVAAGLASGRDLGRLGAFHLRLWPLLLIGVALRLIATAVGESAAVYVASFAMIVAVALVNRGVPGALPIAFGAASNLAVVAANGAMPVDPMALAIAGAAAPHDSLHRVLVPDDRLSALVDVIPMPIFRNVYSAGDVALAVGGFLLPFTQLRRR